MLTALKNIIFPGHIEVLNAQMTNKRTSLHLAAINGHVEIAPHLLEKGANIDVKDKIPAKTLLVAVKYNHHLVVELAKKFF